MIVKSIEISRELVRRWKKNKGGSKMPLRPRYFIDLLNDGASKRNLNNRVLINKNNPFYTDTSVRYRHYAKYDGLSIQTETKNEIYDM